MIFNTATLDNQIARLQEERDRKASLNDAATKALATLADIIDQLDGDAIAILKAELLAIFPKDIQTQQDGEPETIEQQGFEDITDTPDGDPQPEETISDRVSQAKQDYYRLTGTSNLAVSYFKRRDGQLGHVYVGGMSQSRLQAWGHWLYQNGYTAHPPILRESKRLSNWTYELKLPPMSLTYINDLTVLDYTRYPSPSSQVLAA